MFTKIKIGDFAKLNNISIQTLRYYETQDLLKPSYVDPLTNYRYYNINQSSTIDIIHFLKNFEFSLEDIKQILQMSENVPSLIEQVNVKEVELNQQKLAIENKIEMIQSFKEAIKIYEENQEKKEMEIVYFPKRKIVTYEIDKSIFSMDKSEYEFYLRKFKQYLLTQNFTLGSFNRVGSIMKQEDFQRENYISKELFIFIGKNYQIKGKVKELVKGQYAVMYCDSFEEEVATIKKLKTKIQEKKLTIVGDYVCEVVYELPKKMEKERKMFIRLQIPVANFYS